MRKVIEVAKNIISYIFNFFIPTHCNRIYIRCMKNSMWDKYDIINCGSSNLLKYLDYYIKHPHSKTRYLYIEFFDRTRLELYQKISKSVMENNVILIFIPSPYVATDKIRKALYRIKNAYIRFSSALWFSETGDTVFSGKLFNQRIICFNYFISCKSDLEIGKNYRWKFIDKYLITGLLPAQIISSATGVKLDHCLIIGFPRNDTIIYTDRKDKVLKYYSDIIGYKPKKIIVYAPTLRDYELKSTTVRPLFGYECGWLEKYIKDNSILIIYKLHPWQNKKIVLPTNGIIPYISNYDFSLYDVLSISDALISDYSSIVFDYLLIDRPIIYNLYDLETYEKTRGLSYEPYELFCPGYITKNSDELRCAFDTIINEIDEFRGERKRIRQLMYVQEGECTQEVYKSLSEITER